jgi:hypothetical protein
MSDAHDADDQQKWVTLYREQAGEFHYAEVLIGEPGVVVSTGVAGDEASRSWRELGLEDEDAVFEREVERFRSEGYRELEESEYATIVVRVPVAGMSGRKRAMKSWDMDYLLGEYLRTSTNGYFREGDNDDRGDVIVQFAQTVNPRIAARELVKLIHNAKDLRDVQAAVRKSDGSYEVFWPRGFRGRFEP